MSRHHYNAESWTNPDGTIDFGASVPFGAQVRRKIATEKRAGYHMQGFRPDSMVKLGAYELQCDTLEEAEKAFRLLRYRSNFRYITLTDLSTNTIIKDHSTKDENP